MNIQTCNWCLSVLADFLFFHSLSNSFELHTCALHCNPLFESDYYCLLFYSRSFVLQFLLHRDVDFEYRPCPVVPPVHFEAYKSVHTARETRNRFGALGCVVGWAVYLPIALHMMMFLVLAVTLYRHHPHRRCRLCWWVG